jgi:hypothetical protein
MTNWIKAVPADDGFHEVGDDDVFWTETKWFVFSVPERGISGMWHSMFRFNQGVCNASVCIWDDSGQADSEVLYSQNFWHLPLPEEGKQIRLVNGLKYDVLEPLRRYRLRYDVGTVKFDLEYEGICEPIMAGHHIDQPCRVTGTLEIRGESIRVDSYEMRDQSWHVRSDLGMTSDITEGSYSYAITPNSAACAWFSGSPMSEQTLLRGWLFRDGKVSALTSASRTTSRKPDGSVRDLQVQGSDELGRTFQLSGATINNLEWRSSPVNPNFVQQVEYDFDGVPASGQTNDWSMQLFRSTRSAT